MFNKSNNHLHIGATTLISKATTIKGDLHFSGSLELEGTLTGNIIADSDKASLRVQKGGKVIGKIRAPKIIINGVVEGDVISTEHLELAVDAQINGNVYYDSLEIVKGAEVNGKLIHQDKSAVKQAEPKVELKEEPAK